MSIMHVRSHFPDRRTATAEKRCAAKPSPIEAETKAWPPGQTSGARSRGIIEAAAVGRNRRRGKLNPTSPSNTIKQRTIHANRGKLMYQGDC